MAYMPVDTLVGAQPITTIDDSAKHVIGTKIRAYDSTYGVGTFVYLPGVANCATGLVVAYDEKAGTTTLTLAATRGPVAVAVAAVVAGKYGWFQVEGSAVVKAAAAVVAAAPAYSTATAGNVDDAVTAGSKIDGMVFKTADGTPSAGYAVAQIANPSLNGNG